MKRWISAFILALLALGDRVTAQQPAVSGTIAAAGSNVSLAIDGAATVTIAVTAATTCTFAEGQVNFEVSPDAGVNWYSVTSIYQTPGASVYFSCGDAVAAYIIPAGGFNRVRAISAAGITGGHSVAVTLRSNPAAVTPSAQTIQGTVQVFPEPLPVAGFNGSLDEAIQVRSAAPTGAEAGVVVRNIPSGKQESILVNPAAAGSYLGVAIDGFGGVPLEVQGTVSTVASTVDTLSTLTPGSTGVYPPGYTIDDVAPASLAETALGVPRMSPKRVPLSVLTDDTGTRVATATTTPGAGDLGLVVRGVGAATETTLSAINTKTYASAIATATVAGSGAAITISDLSGIGSVGVYSVLGTASGVDAEIQVSVDGTTYATADGCWNVSLAQFDSSLLGTSDQHVCVVSGFRRLRVFVNSVTGGNVTFTTFANPSAPGVTYIKGDATVTPAASVLSGWPSKITDPAASGQNAALANSNPIVAGPWGLVVRDPNAALVKTNTDTLLAAGAGGYVRQDSTFTMARESGGNLASVKTNTDKLDIALSALRDALTGTAVTGKSISDLYTLLASVIDPAAHAVLNRPSAAVPGLALPPCNPVRRVNCSR